MIGAVIFLIFFILFTLLSLPQVMPQFQIPPGEMILDWLNISLNAPWSDYTIALLNGLIYGFAIWLIYSLARIATRREKVARAPPPKPVAKPVVEPVARARAPSPLDQGIEQIEGIGPSYTEKLKGANITTIKDLLKAGATKKGRQTLAKVTDASESTVLKWVNRADLFRIKGIGKEYSQLLDVAGVNTVVELSKRDPASLRAKLEEVNREKSLVKQLPSVETITEWIRHAKRLKRRVEY